MSLNDLFDISTSRRLPADVNTWGEQIIDQLVKSAPSVAGLVSDVKFIKCEPVKGTAIGFITLVGKAQTIPFIIDEHELNPLDMFMDGEKGNRRCYPLTERAAARFSARSWPFKLLSTQERQSILKTASLYGDESWKIEFVKQNADLLAKVAELHKDIMPIFSSREPEQAAPVHEHAVHCIVKSAAVEAPILVRDLINDDKHCKISDFTATYGKEVTQRLMREGSIVLSNMPSSVKLDLDAREIRGAYKPSEGRDGVCFTAHGAALAHRYDHYRLDGSLAFSTPSIVLTANGEVLYSDKLYKPNASHSIDPHQSRRKPKIGEQCLILIGDNAYGPVYLKGVSHMGDATIYHVSENGQSVVNIRTNHDVKTLISLDKSNMLISCLAQIVAITEDRAVAPSLAKTASLKVVVSRLLNKKLSINDAGTSGIDSNRLMDLGHGDALVALRRCGLTESDARYAIMRASEAGTYAFPAEPKSAPAVQAPDPALAKTAEVIRQLCKEGRVLDYVVKTAVITGDVSNVDSTLGLNLVTFKNIRKFKLYIPELNAVMDRLCKFVFLKRMNRLDIALNETEVMQAARAIDGVIGYLNSL